MRWLSLGLRPDPARWYPLWLGRGWLKVWEAEEQVQQQKAVTRKLEIRNAGLDAEVRDLKQGYDAIEERARFELGMIRQDETFVSVPENAAQNKPP